MSLEGEIEALRAQLAEKEAALTTLEARADECQRAVREVDARFEAQSRDVSARARESARPPRPPVPRGAVLRTPPLPRGAQRSSSCKHF